MFCIKCGKDAVRGNFCSECFSESRSLFEIEPRISIKFCEMCGMHHSKSRIVEVNKLIKNMLKSSNNIKTVEISKTLKGNRIIAKVTCTGTISGIPKKETKRIDVTVRRHKCDNCIKISGNYHEAVIQVRGERREKIASMLKSILHHRTVAAVIPVKNGYDIRIIDKKKADSAVQNIRDGFEVKESYKLVGEKKGTKLYRNYYAVR